MLSLAIRDLEVSFPGLERPALAIPDLSLAPGERIAVTGPSGCGKTTFINIVTGLERVRRGRVSWQDTDLAALSEAGRDRWRAKNVGLVMQDFHLFPGLSAIDNVLLPKRLAAFRLAAGMAGEAERLLKRVGIERLDQPVETMSRGQMQRVAVARALVGKPSVVVADEPTASLDADSGAAVADLLLELAEAAGVTLIVASHERRLVDRLERVLRMESGRIVSDAPQARASRVPVPA
ncbi:ABC transporter ATP-binding protein [Aurantimonas sp. VKM B-3413]|uniref:ABC transporter ATP-binding protein n=1 Tax=Aurantimonas sp. VKM B-3413 TaxID=2779401 RepID=UPI001E59766C|nr:ABC transporter ATP-binding protein [Aurantimonas sp. VKM B-3413]MCB8839796.1 ABC transporter ATP-binding protein [Aurantimonas sp. VKM B-3413]